MDIFFGGLFGEGGAEFAFDGGEFGFTAEVVEFAGIGVEVVEFVNGPWGGEVGGAVAGREFSGGEQTVFGDATQRIGESIFA